MPFASEAQRRFLWSQHPEIAKEFAKETPKDKQLPKRVKSRKKRKRRPTVNARNPLRYDPTRTITLRRKLASEFSKRFAALKGRIVKLVSVEDGLALNTRWRFATPSQKVTAFQGWLDVQVRELFQDMQAILHRYAKMAYTKGAGRSYDDVKKNTPADEEQMAFNAGARAGFLQTTLFGQASEDKVKLLADRSFTDLQGITQDMSVKMSRILADGMTQGLGPREVSRQLVKQVGLSKDRALLIAQTETIRAHASGQLDALEQMGVERVGVRVEVLTAGDAKVCPLCQELEGATFTLAEARGLIPRHPRCRCSFTANLDDSTASMAENRDLLDFSRWVVNYSPDQPREPAGSSVGGQWSGGSAAGTIGSWASKAAALPKRIYQAAVSKVRTQYTKLESRYGKATAITILAAGVLATPIPIPGTTLLAVAPIIGAAELYKYLAGSGVTGNVEQLTQEELTELGKQFIQELLSDWDKSNRA